MTTNQQARDLAALPAHERKLVSRIIVATASELRIDYARLIDPDCLKPAAADGRRICYKLIRESCPALTLEQIGGIFSRSISSVSKDLNTVSDWCREFPDGQVAGRLATIRKEVGL